jgi:hypothetical protein
MKKYILATFLLASVAVMVMLYSCKKALTKVADYKIADSSMAYIKIVDAADSFRARTGRPDTFALFINNIRVTSPNSATSTALSFGGVWPVTTTASNGYLAVYPGVDSIKLAVPGQVIPDSLYVTAFLKNLLPGKYYTFLVTDSVKSARDSNRIFVQDVFTTPVPGYINLRFANAVINDTAGKTVDLWSYSRNAAVVSKIKPDSITSFQVLGINTAVSDTFYVRRTGTTLNLAKLAIPFNSQRTYTLFYYGDGNLTAGKKARALGSFNHF